MVHSPVAAPTIHGEGSLLEANKPFSSEVLSCFHRSHDACEAFKLSLPTADQRLSFEERDDLRKKIGPSAHYEHQRGVA